MEYITNANFEKYNAILEEINTVHKELEDIERKTHFQDQELFAVNLCKMTYPAKICLLQLKVKVMQSVFQISQLHTENISESELLQLSKYDGHKFYVTEIYIFRKVFHKMIRSGWFFSVSVKNGNNIQSKTVSVPRGSAHPILVIIPFKCSTEDSEVDVNLIWMKKFKSERDNQRNCSNYAYLHVESIPIDISYHLMSYSIHESRPTREEVICKMTEHFKKSEEKNKELFYVTRKFTYFGEVCSLFEVILKNSYCSLDPRKGSVCTRTQSIIVMKFYADSTNNMISITFNKENHELEIEAPSDIMNQLTKCFISMSDIEKTVKLSKLPSRQTFQELKIQLQNALADENKIDVKEVLRLEEELSDIISTLPLIVK